VLGLGALLLILPMPGQTLRRRLVRGAARLALAACGLRLVVQFAERLPAGACIVVANHASYLDGIVLYAALPPTFGFVIKREMSQVPGANLLLRRIGSQYVDRGGGGKARGDTRQLLKRAQAGGALAFFPEGTFDREPGLAPFRAGAFVIAARVQVPIVPIAIRGTRHALPCGSLLPQPGRIEIELAPPLPPPGTGENDLRASVHAARSAILQRIPEPDLAS
jgi:1-acyl-sn-glycerol-3-phosphate acyltransferase